MRPRSLHALLSRAALAATLLGALTPLACGSDDAADDATGGAAGATAGTGNGGAAGAGSGGASGGSTAGGGGSGTGGSGTGGSAGTPNSGGSGGSSGGGSGGTGGVPIPPPVPDDCITDVTAKPDHVFTCSNLKWNVSVPPACVTNACGLVFDVHGFSMSGKMEDANSELTKLGAAHGFIVVNPNADPAPPLSSWSAASDDPKVFDFLQRVAKAFHVDSKRIHFAGFSQGGDMTWRFLCDHSDVIASAAPAAFGLSPQEGCFSKGKAPPREVPILYMHGTKDALIAFSTAQTARDSVIAAYKAVKTATVSSDGQHQWDRYGSAKGTVFEFLQHDYTGAALIQGHCFPGSTDPGGQPGQVFSFKCNQAAPFKWGEAVMQFFLAHPMP